MQVPSDRAPKALRVLPHDQQGGREIARAPRTADVLYVFVQGDDPVGIDWVCGSCGSRLATQIDPALPVAPDAPLIECLVCLAVNDPTAP